MFIFVSSSTLTVLRLEDQLILLFKTLLRSGASRYRRLDWSIDKFNVAKISYSLGCVDTNRIESSPIQSSQTHKDLAVTLWLTMAAAAVRTQQQRRVESSRVESHKTCRVKSLDAACFIFVSQTLVIRRDGCYLEEENVCGKAYSFS